MSILGKITPAISLLLVAGVAWADRNITVVAQQGPTAGSTLLKIHNAYQSKSTFGKRLIPRTLALTVPSAIARRFVEASAKGANLWVTTGYGDKGPMVRVQAGEGKDAVIIGRYRQDGPNGQNSLEGVRTVQFGLGAGAQTFYVGLTRSATQIKNGKFRGSSGVTRYGWSTFVDPTTLAPIKGRSNGPASWFMKKASGMVTDPGKPLASGSYRYEYPESLTGETPKPRVVTAARATLKVLAGGL